jgi:hypothetical protein
MKADNIFLVLVIVFLSGCASGNGDFADNNVFKKEFITSDNKQLNLYVKKNSHVLLNNSEFSVKLINAFISSSSQTPCKPEIVWFFKINLFPGFYGNKILISEIKSGFFEDCFIAEAELPDNKRKFTLRSMGSFVFSASNQWLFNGKNEFLIFKIEIIGENNKKSVLYQPFYLSLIQKERYLRAVNKIKSSKNCPERN